MGRLAQVHRTAERVARQAQPARLAQREAVEKANQNAMRACEKAASGGGANKATRTLESAQKFLSKAGVLEDKVAQRIKDIKSIPLIVREFESLQKIGYFHGMLVKHIALVERRLVQGEAIAHEDKVFSLFEPHTELIKKGKIMPPVEFGHRLLISTGSLSVTK